MKKIATALVMLAVADKATAAEPIQLAQVTTTSATLSQGRVVRLEDQLTFGLRATRPDQRGFLRKVAEGVEKGNLDRGKVNAIYKWALERNGRFPFPYFERAIRLEANRNGFLLPAVQTVIRPLGQTG